MALREKKRLCRGRTSSSVDSDGSSTMSGEDRSVSRAPARGSHGGRERERGGNAGEGAREGGRGGRRRRERLTDQELHEAHHAIEHGHVGLLKEVVTPAQLPRAGLELPAREFAALARGQVRGRARRSVLQVERADAEELRVRTRARAEGTQDGDGALLRRFERVEVRLVEGDAVGEGFDAGQFRAAGVQGGCGRAQARGPSGSGPASRQV